MAIKSCIVMFGSVITGVLLGAGIYIAAGIMLAGGYVP
jgi:hypothetical protein